MKQKKLCVILFLLICFIVLIPNKVLGVEDYIIQQYNINMVVNEDNTFNITENITAYFNVPKHGIYRKIPLKNSIQRLDGTSSKNKVKLTDISVSEKYNITDQNNYKVIRIGSVDKTIQGEYTYTISYKYDIGRDPLKNIDELYFNLIGNEWDTNINKVTFTITMPKSFDKTFLGFSSGNFGSADSSNIVYSVKGNTIVGETKDALKAGQALTVRLTLPEGYFIRKNISFDLFSIMVMILCAVFVLITDRIWAKYGKDDKVVETVEFYPPEGCNSAETAFLYKGKVDTKGIISLLIYLANQGYLEIEEISKKGLFSSSNFRITKIKDYTGNNEYERLFFNGLFNCAYKRTTTVSLKRAREIMHEAKKKGEKIKFNDALEMSAKNYQKKNSITALDLYDNFYGTLYTIEAKMNSKKNKNKIFESIANGKRKYIMLMIVAILVLITIKPAFENESKISYSIGTIVFSLTGFIIAIMCIVKEFNLAKLPVIFFAGFIWGALFVNDILPGLTENLIYLVTYIVGMISIVVLIIFIKIMPKRTAYGTEMLGKIRGFKRFLETAEKPQLELLVKDNPQYFYNILPFTYALGVSETWMKQFETIAMQAPNWYSSDRSFNIHEFNGFVNCTMRTANNAMTSTPSSSGLGGDGSGGSSSGGGSSGGGFSGGGSGGGRRKFMVIFIHKR